MLGHFFDIFSKTPFRVPLGTLFDDFKPPTGSPMGELISGLAPLWAPVAPHRNFECKKYAQSAPKISSREQNWCQKGAQGYLKWPKVISKGTQKSPLEKRCLSWGNRSSKTSQGGGRVEGGSGDHLATEGHHERRNQRPSFQVGASVWNYLSNFHLNDIYSPNSLDPW